MHDFTYNLLLFINYFANCSIVFVSSFKYY